MKKKNNQKEEELRRMIEDINKKKRILKEIKDWILIKCVNLINQLGKALTGVKHYRKSLQQIWKWKKAQSFNLYKGLAISIDGFNKISRIYCN